MSIIYKNANGDTRTANNNVSFQEFKRANDMHKEDVKNVMNELAFSLMCCGINHDFTKKSHEELFYKNFLSTMNNNTDFVNDEWYQHHIKSERHHLNSNCHDDVNLLDVLEMIVDVVCSENARGLNEGCIKIDNDILAKAFSNTIKYINNLIHVNN